MGLESVLAPEELSLRVAECGIERVACQPREFGIRILVHHAVLDPEAADLDEVTLSRVVRGEKLGDNGDFLARVDSLARSEETLVAHPPRVEVAATLITNGRITLCTCAAILPGNGAGMEAKGRSL